jgi:uncharacterized protein (TIGR02597 family)
VVGYNQQAVPANTDVRLSVPFCQSAVGSYAVNTKTASGVTVTATLSSGVYANLYYVRFISGSAAGLWSTISTNGTGSFDLADAGVLAQVSVGDTFRVYPHYTLRTLFPVGMLNVSYNTSTKILLFDNSLSAMAQNRPASKTASYVSGNWLGSGVNNNTVLAPETQFILRNNSSTPLTMITQGFVPDYTVSMLIAPSGDLNVGTGYPVPVVLKNSGLGASLRKVLFYDNTATGENKPAVKTATYSGGNWIGSGVTGNELLSGSQTITLRLPTTEAGTKVTIQKPY